LSRYTVQVANGTETDPDATIGFDPPLRTFFLQAFPDPETDECALWLGTDLEEFPTLESIIKTARDKGYEIGELSHDIIVGLIKEAGPLYPPSLAERLGIVRQQRIPRPEK